MSQRASRRNERAFWGVLLADFVVQTGFGAILPLLPEFVTQRGFPRGAMGFMAAAYALVSFLAQLGLGPVADKVGLKWLIVSGSVVEALGTAGFLLHGGTVWYVGCRVVQGLGSAGVIPAANALVAAFVPPERRGRAYGMMAAAGSAGFAVGPVLGGLAGASLGLAAPFVIGVVLNLAATAVSLVWISPVTGEGGVWQGTIGALYPLLARVWPYFWVMFSWTGLTGMYDTSWSLYMAWLGASRWVIGLSFTLYALPLFAFNLVGGRIADRPHRRQLIIVAGTMLQALTVLGYALSRSAWLSIAISVVEAGAMSLTGPALSAAVMEDTPNELRGGLQSWFQASGTLGATIMALVSGPLLVKDPNHPFYLGAAVLWLTSLGVAGVWKPWRQ